MQREGNRVRYFIGAPVFVAVVVMLVLLIFYRTREPPVTTTVLRTVAPVRDLPPIDEIPATAPTSTGTDETTGTSTTEAPAGDTGDTDATDDTDAVTTTGEPAEQAPKAQRQRPTGSIPKLTKSLNKACNEGSFLKYNINVIWKTDAQGLLIPTSVQSTDTRSITQDCVVPELRKSGFVWDPNRTYRALVQLSGVG